MQYIPPASDLRSRIHRQVMANAVKFSRKNNQHLQGISAGEIARNLKVPTQQVLPHIRALLGTNSICIKPGAKENTHAYLQTFAKFIL